MLKSQFIFCTLFADNPAQNCVDIGANGPIIINAGVGGRRIFQGAMKNF